jgi:putative DNA primase/helicase
MADAVLKEHEDFNISNNSVVGFMEDGGKCENESTKSAYLDYCIWCGDNGLKALSKTNFSRQLNTKYGLSTKVVWVDSKCVRYYSKV